MIEIVTLFKTSDQKRFVEALEEAVHAKRGEMIDWSPRPGPYEGKPGKEFGRMRTDTVCSLWWAGQNADITARIAETLRVPSINLYFQLHSIWEIAVRVEGKTRVFFSVDPKAWAGGGNKAVGSAQDVAEVWQVPVEQIEKYLVDWQPDYVWNPAEKMKTRTYTLRGKKAYPTDQHGYGEQEQGFDLIRALGGEDPMSGTEFWIPSAKGRR